MEKTLEIDPEYEYRRIGDFYSAMDEILIWPDSRLLTTIPHASSWSIGQHVIHISMAHSAMWRTIGKIMSDKHSNEVAAVIAPGAAAALARESFPRNKFQAPDLVKPESTASIEDVKKWSRISRIAFNRIATLAPTLPETSSFIPHPIMGPLDARAWLRTIRIHGEHHLAIVRDINEEAV